MQLPGWITSLALACCLHGLAETEPETLGRLDYHAAPQKLPAGAVVAEWPRFLGPNNDASSPETKLLATWPE